MYKIGDKFMVNNNELFQDAIVYIWKKWRTDKNYYQLRKLGFDYSKDRDLYFDVIHKETLKNDWEEAYIPLCPALEIMFDLD